MVHSRLAVDALVVDETVRFSLSELCRACEADSQGLIALVEEGVLHPEGEGPASWSFDGASLRRARTALRLSRGLGLDAGGTALVLELLDEIATLKARLRRAGLA